MLDLRRSILNAASGLALVACSTPASLAPSHAAIATTATGDPVELVKRWAGVCADNWGPDRWVEGLLVAGHDRSRNDGRLTGWTYLAFRSGTAWPASIPPDEGMTGEGGVAVFWPGGFTGARLPEGELAVTDASGNLVAATGRNYKLKVQFPTKVIPGYPDASRIEGMEVCGGSGTVIPE
jgi:hypothetical protein